MYYITINKIRYKFIFVNSIELLNFMEKNSLLQKSFIKVAEDNYKMKSSFSLNHLIMTENFYKKKSKKIMYFLIFNDSHILTTSRIIYSNKNGYINFVRTNRNFRKIGLCYRNIKKLIELSNNKLNIHSFSLEVEKDNIAAIKCYQKNGFKIDKKNDDSYILTLPL